MRDQFESEFCSVIYNSNEKVVLLTWKKFCAYDDYRNPTTFALELLKKYKDSQFVVDARNGFEDDKADVEWGFKVLLPEMSKTTCKKVVFILNEASTIEDEMSMWEKEFNKYFTVKNVLSYDEAIAYLKV
ncbi:hypothetical protein LY28_03410 [Ruminiclostridium sufflavum DSM 19573]|uniref:Uncharacterized protein n=1 Tax=Ruminiclostridium sufflavum DSM 19573 TaxID=1121337 RepID=A0A318XG86_9FIRM|nr:hypothetical protein [Ruminiclostridium sufflavum]PYG84952.1 hypothetical protein LY28_03410 [Ruminiclostridium sufflavum DSM 19573]